MLTLHNHTHSSMFTTFLEKTFIKEMLSKGVNHHVSDSLVIPQIHFMMTHIDKIAEQE